MEKMGQIPEHHWLKWPTMPLYSLQSRWRKVCKHSSCHTGFPRCFDISLLKRDKVPTDCYPLKYVNVLPVFLSFAYFYFFCSEVLLVEVKSGLARIHVWVFGTFLLQDFPQSFRAAQESSHNGPKTHRKTKLLYHSNFYSIHLFYSYENVLVFRFYMLLQSIKHTQWIQPPAVFV